MMLAQEKKALREALKAAERQLDAAYRAQADAAIVARLLESPAYQNADTIFCFVATPREIETRPFLLAALEQGKRICVPRCAPERQMDLVLIQSLDDLETGAYGIPEPKIGLPLLTPDEIQLAIVPCLSCDHHGNRLGRGGGYYDRFLAVYSGASILICREKLVQEHIPAETHDIPISQVITEAGVFSRTSTR